MYRGKDDDQLACVEQHRDTRRAAQMRKQIGMAFPGKTGKGKRELVDRCGGNRIDATGAGVVDRAHDAVIRGLAGFG